MIKFLNSKNNFDNSRIILFGIPFDGTSTYRFGSRKAPHSIRIASDSIETYSPYQDKDLNAVAFFDAGNLKLASRKNTEKMMKAVSGFTDKICKHNKIPFALGGEHLISYPVIKSLKTKYDNMTVIQFDAHTDLREDYEGVKFSHATVMKRVFELGGIDIIQTGIRSGTKEEYEFMKKNHTFYEFFKKDLILEKIKGKNVYLTIDIDVFDPSVIPGTGNPEPGGITFLQFMDFIKHLKETTVIGIDVVELNPLIDPTQVSSIIIAEIVRELLLVIPSFCN